MWNSCPKFETAAFFLLKYCHPPRSSRIKPDKFMRFASIKLPRVVNRLHHGIPAIRIYIQDRQAAK